MDDVSVDGPVGWEEERVRVLLRVLVVDLVIWVRDVPVVVGGYDVVGEVGCVVDVSVDGDAEDPGVVVG